MYTQAMSTRDIMLNKTGEILIPKAKWCDSYFTRMRGFTFTKPVQEKQGLVLVNARDSRVDSSITMFFVNYDLGVIWVNSKGRVVDTLVAKSWRPSYASKDPARYVIEGHPSILDKVEIGDLITFVQ